MSIIQTTRKETGYTIVEIIIVVVVLAIVVSIAVVSYNGSQNKAYDAAVVSDLDNMRGLMENFRVSPSNSTHLFPQTTSDLSQLGIKASKTSYLTSLSNNLVFCVNTSTYLSYSIVAASKSSTVFLTNQDGPQATTLTISSFSNPTSLCTSLGMNLIASGMTSANTWQSWVGN